MTRFATILVANRGEIACRVMRTARALGYRTVAVHSDADRDALHVRMADAAFRIGPAAPAQSYLSIAAVIEAAKAAGADAIHPGYGFLSENPDFADACAAAGIAFIGPPASAMRAMGGKASAKALMRAAGVPVVPGYEGDDQSDARLFAEAVAIGFPVMIKASAGGGGRGMRLVDDEDAFGAALASARAEAMAGFGDDRLLIENAILRPRHVEIQVMADRHGNVIHLGERDCSVQRRHQKVIEEAPSPAVTPAIRAAMGKAAVDAARAVAYVGAGTVEFLLDGSGGFHFLEMNTRLQVEHPVTEAVTGLDLVAMQIAIAEGQPLTVAQDDIAFAGHAIEARLCAEDPANGFLPATGRLIAFSVAEGVRTDAGVESGSAVSPHYDSLIAKVIAHGATRAEALARLDQALRATVVLGVVTNRDFLVRALALEDFAEGRATTAFIADNREAFAGQPDESRTRLALAAALLAGPAPSPDPAWRAVPLVLETGGSEARVSVRHQAGATAIVSGLGEPVQVELAPDTGDRFRFTLDGATGTGICVRDGAQLHLDAAGHLTVADITYRARRGAESGEGTVRAPMAGTVARVLVRAGDSVRRGQTLAVLEAMKMEHNVTAAIDGIVDALNVAQGQQVAGRSVIATIRSEEPK